MGSNNMKDLRLTESEKRDLENDYENISNIHELQDYFGHRAVINYGYWDDHTVNQNQASENLIKMLLAFIPDKSGNILDVAFGRNGTTHYLLNYYHPANVVGINISIAQLEMDRDYAKTCAFLLMDATEMGFEDCSFENILCVEAASHFNSRRKFFQEALRVLKPGGHLVLSDILMTLEAEKQRIYRTEKNHISDPGEYANWLREVGFQGVKVIDATDFCWKGAFWNAVRYFHKQFLTKKIDQAQLKAALDLTYRCVPDTKYYILAAGRKP
jgi:MPBQ/MSBQ methyltransferase